MVAMGFGLPKATIRMATRTRTLAKLHVFTSPIQERAWLVARTVVKKLPQILTKKNVLILFKRDYQESS